MKNILTWLSILVLGLFGGPSTMAYEPVIVDNGNSGKATVQLGRELASTTDVRENRTKYVDIRTYAYLGYIKSEMAYREVSERMLTNLNNGQFWSHVTLGHSLEPEYLMAPTDPSSGVTTIWFGVSVTCEEGFYPSDLVFTLTSNDSDPKGSNRFGKVEYYNRSNYIYSGTSFAQVNGGPLITSGPWNATKANRFMFIGSLSMTANANNQGERDSVRRWMWSYPNFGLTGTWSLVENGVTIASSSHEMRLLTPPELKIGFHNNGGFVLLEADGHVGRDMVIEVSTVSGVWKRVFIAAGGGKLQMPITGEWGRSAIFRASSIKPFGY